MRTKKLQSTIFGLSVFQLVKSFYNMCLFPKFILNKKYLPTKKNNYNPPQLTDERLKYVAVGCGNCIECRKQKANEWRIRLSEELKIHKYKYFVTLTFSEESLKELYIKGQNLENNAIAGKAVRMFLERWRKEHKKSVKHWLITELGHEGTERIHLHGIIFTEEEMTNEKLERIWKYGHTDNGKYCNQRSINYIVKYVTKIDNDHKGYKAQIFCSAGLGANYTKSINYQENKFKDKETFENYILNNGNIVNLPIYYRNKRYTEEEREKLWLNKIEQHIIYIRGIKIDISTDKGINEYLQVLKTQQEENTKLGYGDNSKEWQKKPYNITLRKLNEKSRLQNYQNKSKNIT